MILYLYNRALLTDEYNSVGLPLDRMDELLELLWSARKVGLNWVSPKMRFLDDCDQDSDFPTLISYASIPVVSGRGWRALQPLIGDHVEALPFEHPRGEYYLLNVLNVLDCIDLDRSHFTINEVTGRVNEMTHFVFRTIQLIQGKHLFWTPLQAGSNMLVDDAFRDCVLDHKLVGLDLRPVP